MNGETLRLKLLNTVSWNVPLFENAVSNNETLCTIQRMICAAAVPPLLASLMMKHTTHLTSHQNREFQIEWAILSLIFYTLYVIE
jgi:hypothetical protein